MSDNDPLAPFRRERWQRNGMDSPEAHEVAPVMSEHEALKRAIEALNQIPNHKLRNDVYTNTYKLIPDLEKAYQARSERTKLEELAPRMYRILLLCEDVLNDLARLDDGTPSVSVLTEIRAIQKEAGNLSEEQVIKLTQGIPVQVLAPGTEGKGEATMKLLDTLVGPERELAIPEPEQDREPER